MNLCQSSVDQLFCTCMYNVLMGTNKSKPNHTCKLQNKTSARVYIHIENHIVWWVWFQSSSLSSRSTHTTASNDDEEDTKTYMVRL